LNKLLNYTKWLVILIFPIGFYISYKLIDNFFLYFLFTTCNIFSSTFIVYSLKKFKINDTYLWVIFYIFIFAYFVKYYILTYLFININDYYEYLEIYYPIETEYFKKPEIILNYFQDITFILFSFSLYIKLFVYKNNRNKNYNHIINNLSNLKVSNFKLKILLGFVVSLWIIFLNIQLNLKLGFVSGNEEYSTKLPYHLGGLIMTVLNLIVPLLFLLILFFSTTSGFKGVYKSTTFIYIIYGVVTGLVSTSKASIYSVIISLFIVWLLTNRLNKKKIFTILLTLPLLSLFNLLLSAYRVSRIYDPNLTIGEITYRLFSSFRTNNFDELTNGGTQGAVLKTTQSIGLFMRLNGADSYLNILNYNPSFSFKRIIDLIIFEPKSIYVLYSEEVLGLPSTAGLAFSPSLLGYLKFLLGNTIAVCIGFFLYILFWHLIFSFVRKLNFTIEPIIISMLIILLAHYTSEGTLEAMPFSIFIILLISFIIEKVFIYYFKK
jgi:hypothetical protein